MTFKFAHLIPDKYSHVFVLDLADPRGSHVLTIDRHLYGKQFAVDIRLDESDLGLSEEEFAKSILVPAIAALVRHEQAL